MFDVMARRYSKLPSEILREADSFDVMVMDVAHTYESWLQAKQDKTGKSVEQFMDQRQMQEHFNKVTGKG